MLSQNHPYLFFMMMVTAFICLTIIFITWTISQLIPDTKKISKGNVGIINIEKVIKESDKTIQNLKKFTEAKNIKAVVVRIDSPGGAVGPSQEIYNEICKVSSKKKVIVSMGSIAASGGYYIASAANHIFANPGTLTGSIGVVMSFPNVEELIQKIGLDKITIKSGQYKDIGSPTRNMTEKERQLLQELSDEIHEQFITDIVKGRNVDISEIKKIADGRIFTGEKAKQLKLVDSLGNLNDAIEYAGKITGIETDKIKLVYPREKKQSLKEIIGISIETLIEKTLNCNFGTKIG